MPATDHNRNPLPQQSPPQAATAPLRSVPRLPWPNLQARLSRQWKPGQHVTIIGPTRSGKTHLALTLAELCRYVLVLSTKRRDPLVSQLQAKGYLVTSDTSGVLWAENEPVHRRVVVHPAIPDKTTAKQRLDIQARVLARTMDWADKTGGWSVVVDETMWMADRLKLGKELDSLWYQGRTQGLSVIACAQRPSRVPRLAFSQADYLFIAKFSDKRDVETLRDISSTIPRELIESSVRSLSKDRHEFLFLDTVNDELAIVVAPPR